MKKLLSMTLSLALIISLLLAVAPVAKAADGITPGNVIINPDNGYEEIYDYEKGAGYITIEEHGGENAYVEIINLFHSEEVTPYNGVTYDLATNTLTLTNANLPNWEIRCDQMFHLKVKVVGTCVFEAMNCWDTFPSFTGTGNLTLNNGIQGAGNSTVMEKGIAPMSVDNNVTLTLKKGAESQYCAQFQVSYKTTDLSPAKVLTYAGKVSEPLKWDNQPPRGGPSEDWITLTGVRNRTVFKATEILKKNDYTGENNYYIKSISQVGNEPMIYHHISQLVYKDGYWFEKDDGNNYWNKDSLFTNYTDAEVSSLPSTLVDSSGYATAYLANQFAYGQAYVKDNNVYIFNGSGRVRNLIVNPTVPAESVYGNDLNPTVAMKLVKQIPSEDVNLVELGEEYEIDNAMNYDKQAEAMKSYGYEKLLKMVDHPYDYSFTLTNTSVTFSPADPVKTDTTTADNKGSSVTKAIADTISVKVAKLSKPKSPKKGQIKASWKKQTDADGYQIQYGLKKNFKGAKSKNVNKNKTTSVTLKKLKSGKKYYIRIRSFKKVSGKKVYSDWSKAKTIKVK